MRTRSEDSSTPGAGGISRRSVVRSAAWSVPVIAAAAAAPAFAASPCPTGTAVWSSFPATAGKLTSGGSMNSGNAIVTITYTGDTTAANNATIYTAGQTGGVSNALRFYDRNNVSNTSQTITITFDKMVKNVSLTLLDVDSATNSFYDQVSVLPAGFSYTRGSQVIGVGTVADPFNASTTNTVVAGTSTTGNVALSWGTASLNQISFVYSQGGTATGSPFIGISNMTFNAQDC